MPVPFKKDPVEFNQRKLLAEDVFDKLAEKVGSPFPREAEEYMASLKKMERFMDDERLMYKLVKGFRPRYDDAKINIVIKAFREAYDNLFFEDMMSDV